MLSNEVPHMTAVNTMASEQARAAAQTAVRNGEHQLAELRRLAEQMRAQFALMERAKVMVLPGTRLTRVLESVEGSLEIARDLAVEVGEMATAVDAVAAESVPAKTARERAAEFIAAERWTPGETDLQRGRAALLEEFRKPHNLTVSQYAKLAGVSRQQIYKDLSATSPKLLALSVGKAGQRVPDWQLEDRSRELTRLVMDAAPELDAWTVYHALSSPSGALEGRAPVDAVKQKGRAVESLATLVLEELGIRAEPA
jgi:hypothetical protein